MDYSRKKIEVFEVDNNGSIVENYLYDAHEINEAIDDNRTIIQSGWDKRLFEPKWDFESKEWIEGLSEEEVAHEEEEINNNENKPTELDLIKQENEMFAMAIMELTSYIMKGGE